jgi:hypothetical protein
MQFTPPDDWLRIVEKCFSKKRTRNGSFGLPISSFG